MALTDTPYYDIAAPLKVSDVVVTGDVSVGDDLTVTDDATIGGTLGVTGAITATGGVTGAVTGNVTGDLTGSATLEDGDLLTIEGAGTGTGDVVARIGATATEGLELRVYEATVTPAAIETNLLNTPAGAVILSVQANCEAALTGGSTTVTWSVGINGNVDKYGTAAGGDTLAKNSKIDTIPDWATLAAAEQMVLAGAVTGGATAGDTALTVGSVRVRVVYLALNSLDDAA